MKDVNIRAHVAKMRVELGEIHKLANIMLLDDVVLELQKCDLYLYSMVKTRYDRYKNEGGAVRFPDNWDYFTRLQSLLDDTLIMKEEIKNVLELSDSHKEHIYLNKALHRISKAIRLLNSDDIIPV